MSLPELTGGSGILCGAAVLMWLAVAAVGLLKRKLSGLVLSLPTIIGCTLLLLAALVGKSCTLTFPFPWFLGDVGFSFVVDPLSRWFLAIIGVIGIPVALCEFRNNLTAHFGII